MRFRISFFTFLSIVTIVTILLFVPLYNAFELQMKRKKITLCLALMLFEVYKR